MSFERATSSRAPRASSIMTRLGIAAVAALSAAPTALSANKGVDPEALLEQLTLDEKLQFFHGDANTYVGFVPGVPRLGIPAITMQDGPQGFRQPDSVVTTGSSTQFPSNLAIGATFDHRIAYYYAKFIAKEFRGKGANMLLGPGVCLNRVPYDGRNFEYLSGEDPVLGAEMAPYYVQGALSENTMTSVKHFIFNNQETEREYVSSEVPEQVGMEYYMKPFIAGVEAGASSIMCAYNKVNGTYACENADVMKRLEKFSDNYFVMSDWGATHSSFKAANAGLAMEMPTGIHMSPENMKKALAEKKLDMKTVDGLVLRTLKALKQAGQLDGKFPNSGDVMANVTLPLHKMAATIFVAESMILLHNQFRPHTGNGNSKPLPLSLEKGKKAEKVFPVGCGHELITGGGGSGHVLPSMTVTVAQVLQQNNLLAQSMEDADAVVYCFSEYSAENSDRSWLGVKGPASIPTDELKKQIEAVAADKSKKLILYVSTPGPFLLPMELSKTDAVLVNIFPGERAGEALAAVLFGRMSPNGKLPFALPNVENEQKMSKEQYPGVGPVHGTHAHYTENLEFGYRWYQARNIQPKFHFGHGLSYGLETAHITNVFWAKEKNLVRFCVEHQEPAVENTAQVEKRSLVSVLAEEASNFVTANLKTTAHFQPPEHEFLRGRFLSQSQLFTQLVEAPVQPTTAAAKLGSGRPTSELLQEAVSQLQKQLKEEGNKQALSLHGTENFDLINLHESSKQIPVKVSVQFYVKHRGRKFLELVQFASVDNVIPNEKSCSLAMYEPPVQWDVSSAKMVRVPEFDLFVSKNGISEAEYVGTYNHDTEAASEPEVLFA
ncbi:unnamed protein product [Amoebophrya sp. A120]|nr:unnamed protein product [Amoebophrya sp. A120]|eukprot:GSA120T00005283001.1